MLKGFFQRRKEKRQEIEAEALRKQEQEFQDSQYGRLLESRRRIGAYMNNPENWQKVSKLQGELLEMNGGLVVGLPQESEGSSSKER